MTVDIGGDGGKLTPPPASPLPSHLSVSDIGTATVSAAPLRLHQVWKGNNRFLLGGRIVLGPDARSLFLTLFLILAPVILFCVFISKRLISTLHHGTIVLVVCILLTLYVILLLFLTVMRDPGIIPRNLAPPDPEDDGSNLSADWLERPVGVPRRLPPTKDVVVNGVFVRIKYCHTCMLYRPPRCSHCSICNNCVERFDHHCPWVGQCIGKRNYRFFFMFVSSTTILCLYVFVFCWVNIKNIMDIYHCGLWKAFTKSPASGILISYTFVAAWFVGGLTSFHLYLIFTNQTTYESFRYNYKRKMNPYNRGCLGNAVEVFFSKIPPSKINFRERVQEESPVAAPQKMSLYFEMPTTSLDIETRRPAVALKDLEEDMQNQLFNDRSLERCETQPHTDWI